MQVGAAGVDPRAAPVDTAAGSPLTVADPAVTILPHPTDATPMPGGGTIPSSGDPDAAVARYGRDAAAKPAAAGGRSEEG